MHLQVKESLAGLSSHRKGEPWLTQILVVSHRLMSLYGYLPYLIALYS